MIFTEMKKNNKIKKDVIEKSWEIICKNSFFSISMQDIANYLNIKKSLLYYYFESKTDLFTQTIDNYFANLKNKFEIIFRQNLTAGEKIKKLTQIYLNEIKKESMLAFLYPENNKIDKTIVSLVKKIQKEIIEYFNRALIEGKKSGEFKNIDPKFTSFAIIGFMDKIKQLDIDPDPNWPKIFIY